MKRLSVFFLLLLLQLLFLLPAGADTLDLTGREHVWNGEVKPLITELSGCEAGTTVDLTGVRIDVKDAAALVNGLPELTFRFTLTVNDFTVDTDLTELDLDSLTKKRIGSTTLTRLLTCMPSLQRVVMFNQRPSVKEMAAIMEQFPDVTFDWTFQINNYLIRTDSTAFSTLKGRQDPRYTPKQLDALKYCKDLVALDVGHNNVSDLTFLQQWPHLKILIVIDSKFPVTDLSPLADMDELEYVELFMQGITDVSPLANKTHLLDLNLCHNDVTDLTPLYSCTNLERLWISYNPHLTEEEVAAFKAALPNCKVETEEYQSTGAGWREHPRYFTMKDVFETRTWRPFATDEATGS